jgi:hypothetical protein
MSDELKETRFRHKALSTGIPRCHWSRFTLLQVKRSTGMLIKTFAPSAASRGTPGAAPPARSQSVRPRCRKNPGGATVPDPTSR